MFFHFFFDRPIMPFIIFVFDADNFGAVLIHFELFCVCVCVVWQEEKKAEEKKEEEKKGEVEKKAAEEGKKEEGKQEAKKEEKKEEKGDGGEKEKEAAPLVPEEIVLRVYMHCEGCARKVRRCLKGFEGHLPRLFLKKKSGWISQSVGSV